MNHSRFASWRFPVLFILFTLASSCSEEDTSINPILTWLDGEGTVEASEVFLDFKGTHYRSATEIHSYTASIKDRVVGGTFEVYNFDTNGNPVSDAKGDVETIVFEENCMTVRITGIITSGSDPAYLGKHAVWTVLDNGSNINETTDIRYPVDPATAKYHCDVGLTLEWFSFKSLFPAGGKVKVQSKDCN